MPPGTMAHSSNANELFSKPDILHCIGDVITNRKLLRDLCLVNRLFNRIFSIYLYRHLWFCESNCDWLQRNNLDLLLANTRLSHVKKLSFAVYVDEDGGPRRRIWVRQSDTRQSQSLRACKRFNKSIQLLLDKTPNLKSFSWLGHPLFPKTLAMLHRKCPALKELVIIHPSNMDARLGQKLGHRTPLQFRDTTLEIGNSSRLYKRPSIPPFANLCRLHIHNMWGPDFEKWRKKITTVLLNSPGLLDLGLSLSRSTCCRYSRINWHHNSAARHPAHFLRELCSVYAQAGGKPLDLQSLHLGLFMFILRNDSGPVFLRPGFSEENQNGGCLDSLANLSQLQELSLDLVGKSYFDGNQESWWQTAPGPLPKLEKLSIRRPTTWLVRWADHLVKTGVVLRQLKINQPLYGSYHFEPSDIRPFGTHWGQLLECKPQEFLVQGVDNAVSNMDSIVAAGDSIRILAMATASPHINDRRILYQNIELIVSRMPKLEGIWIMTTLNEFHELGMGDRPSVQARNAEWRGVVWRAAHASHTLKYFRYASVTWRIERTAEGIRLHELDRMENEGPDVPELFQINLPYSFDSAHAVKYWVDNRKREYDEKI